MKRFSTILFITLTLICLLFTASCGNTESQTTDSTIKTSKTTLSSANDSTPQKYQFRSNELEKYTIVYSGSCTDYYKLALKLETQIYAKYQKRLSTIRDTNSEPSKYEILLGDTNRYDSLGKIMEYSVTVDEGRFRINVGGAFSAEEAVTYLCDNLFNGESFALNSGEYYKKSFLTNSSEITNGASARVMSANILASKFASNTYKSTNYRAEIFAGMLISYTPDVLGLQEVDEDWNESLDDYLVKIQKLYGLTYSKQMSSFEGKVNYTSLLYRSDKFKAEDSGLKTFSWWTDEGFYHNYHMRNVTWTKFSFLDNTNKSFIVANTHWSYRTEHADGNTYLGGSDTPIAINELRTQCKDETSAFLSALRQTYSDIPVFLTGDFNTSLLFFTQSGWTPSSFGIISEEAKSSGTALSTVPTSGHFDHIFGAGNYSICRYEFFTEVNQHALLTDHPFVYADLIF